MEKMEVIKLFKKNCGSFCALLLLVFIISCASKVLNYETVTPLKKIDEFEQKVQIVTQPEPDAILSPAKPIAPIVLPPQVIIPLKQETKKIKNKKGKPLPVILDTRHEPFEIEGQTGFIGRRPIKDPFKVGERVTHSVTYLGLTAGNLTMEMKPYAEVNGRRSYQFQTSIQTRSIFASIYAVDDKSINLMDFDTMIPSVFTLHIKESKQLKEARAYFDRSKNFATYWENV